MRNNNLSIAMLAALRAGHEILKIYNDPSSDFEIERKADHSPLTIADKKAHETIVAFLSRTPYPILSEEGRSVAYETRKAWERLWIVDPLDGTKEFIKRNGEFTVNIALVEKGEPILGVIYVPVTNTMYIGDMEQGAYRLSNVRLKDIPGTGLVVTASEEEKMPVSALRHDGVRVVASRSHMSEETTAYVQRLREKHDSVELVSSGSSIKICLVAEGSADVYPRFAPTMEWDTAAGHAVAKAAGMEIYQSDSDKPLVYNKVDLHNPWFIAEKVRTAKK